jgi:hypothetical protein
MPRMSTNGRAICSVAGCRVRVHGNGLCRVHYDRQRYEETTQQSPEAFEAAEREQRIHGELTLGCVAEWAWLSE